MKKIIITGLLLFILLLSACATTTSSDGITIQSTELTNIVETPDGKFNITLPDNWIYDKDYTEEFKLETDMVLCYKDNDNAFVNIYFFDNLLYEYPIDTALEDLLFYYEDDLVGDYEKTTLNHMNAYVLHHSNIETSNDNETEFNYNGYSYLIDTPYGVVEVDVYFAQEVSQNVIVDPTEEQLEFLHKIAQSFKVAE